MDSKKLLTVCVIVNCFLRVDGGIVSSDVEKVLRCWTENLILRPDVNFFAPCLLNM